MPERRLLALLSLALIAGCTRSEAPPKPAIALPSILLVTLDTTRADAIGPATPSFNALAARGRRFDFAYAAVPQTLPSHLSMLTGLYPAGHGVHENARNFPADRVVLAERLKQAGYETGAFVSAFALARRFGVARGFTTYDDDFGNGRAERPANETTDHALAWLNAQKSQPLFLWVHYYDPHYPYTPPEPFRSRYATNPYLGEVASMDEQLGRLVAAFNRKARRGAAIVVLADHGEGLGDHGEAQHGNLLYQSTMHVPLLLAGPGVPRGVVDAPVSTRRVFHTILDWAGIDKTNSLRAANAEIVVGEAMKPFLDYGWQPQVMTVEGRQKTILAGRTTEVYDVVADPGETKNIAANASLSREVRATLRDYPIPSLQAAASSTSLADEERKKLASLGYVSSDVKPIIRADAPRPADMTALFPILDKASGLFVREQYAEAIPLLEQILARDPHNLDAALRLATAHSALGHDAEATAGYRRAQSIAPDSPDVQTYLALHQARGAEWKEAEPLLEKIVNENPNRVPALEALATIREREGRFGDAIALRQRVFALRTPTPQELVKLGNVAMESGDTATAIDAFEKARAAQGKEFHSNLELGVLYLSSRRFEDARAALDRVSPKHPAYPLALFKRAQVSVLLNESDAAARIAAARAGADAMTRQLIAQEKLFANR
ncbi:MAG: choline-sulfatase [Acidobacteriota bacterium]|jgi:arylsulfatase A-like enzyme/tetratricopeptide (TPR) repeat protein|nr:choline-sulfatase [Acidobacteriota bacterium]